MSKRAITTRGLFDKVRHHLMKQCQQSKGVNGNENLCAYRGDHGLTCAVGCLIDDKFYNRELEGLRITSYEVRRAVERSQHVRLTQDELSMLFDLQQMHDNTPVAYWKEKLGYLEWEHFGGKKP